MSVRPEDSTAVAVSLSTYLGNLEETGWNKHLDRFLAAHPEQFLEFQVSSQQAQEVANVLKSYGDRNIDGDAILQRLYLGPEDRQSQLRQILKGGSAAYFRSAGEMIASRLETDTGGSFQQASLVRVKSTSCKVLAALGLICALTGNEVGAAVASWGFMVYC